MVSNTQHVHIGHKYFSVNIDINKDLSFSISLFLHIVYECNLKYVLLLLQMAGVASALIVLVTILKLGPLFQELPKVLRLH